MKQIFTIILVLLSFRAISQQMFRETESITISKTFDTVVINALGIKNLDIRFNIILDNHIKEMRKNLILDKKKYLCVVRIDNELDTYYTNIFKEYIPNIDNIVDSIYGNYQDFKNYKFNNQYNIGIRTLHRRSRSLNWVQNHKKFFYYNYKGWDILFVSNINIEFPINEKIKELKFFINNSFSTEDIINEKDVDNFKECISSYSLTNYSVTQFYNKILFEK